MSVIGTHDMGKKPKNPGVSKLKGTPFVIYFIFFISSFLS